MSNVKPDSYKNTHSSERMEICGMRPPSRVVDGRPVDATSYRPDCFFKKAEGKGYEIRTPFIWAWSKEEAAEQIKSMPRFHAFIDLGFDIFNEPPPAII